MYRLAWGTSDRAHRKRFRHRFTRTIVTFGFALHRAPSQSPATSASLYSFSYLHYNLHLAIEARRPALDERYVGSQAHPVHMPPRIQVVQGVENDVERREPVDIELAVFDIRMVGCETGVRSELAGDFFCYLGVT